MEAAGVGAMPGQVQGTHPQRRQDEELQAQQRRWVSRPWLRKALPALAQPVRVPGCQQGSHPEDVVVLMDGQCRTSGSCATATNILR